MNDKETSLEFVERMEQTDKHASALHEYDKLLRLAKTSALIEEHNLKLTKKPVYETWRVVAYSETSGKVTARHDADLHTAARAVADKIKEVNRG